VGVPGQVLVRSQPRPANAPDLDHNRMPDTIGDTLAALVQRVEELEDRVDGHEAHLPALHVPEGGVWRGEDFSI
jgi:serine O-acetyltransferase